MQQPAATEISATLTAVAAVTEIAKNITIVGMLIAILWGGKQKWWVFGWVYEAKEKDAEFWRSLSFRQQSATGSAVEGLRETARQPWRENP